MAVRAAIHVEMIILFSTEGMFVGGEDCTETLYDGRSKKINSNISVLRDCTNMDTFPHLARPSRFYISGIIANPVCLEPMFNDLT